MQLRATCTVVRLVVHRHVVPTLYFSDPIRDKGLFELFPIPIVPLSPLLPPCQLQPVLTIVGRPFILRTITFLCFLAVPWFTPTCFVTVPASVTSTAGTCLTPPSENRWNSPSKRTPQCCSPARWPTPSATREPSAALERPRTLVLPVCCLHTAGQLFSAGLSVGAIVQAGMCVARGIATRRR